MRSPHVHAKFIKDWADGWEIQWRGVLGGKPHWYPEEKPTWDPQTVYRRKPIALKATITDGLLTLDDYPSYCLDLGILQEELRDTDYRSSAANLEKLVRGAS